MEKQAVINILKKNGYERYEPNHYVKGSISVNLEQLSVMKSGSDEVFQSFESLLDYLGLSGVAEKQTVFIKRYPSKGEFPNEHGYKFTDKGRIWYNLPGEIFEDEFQERVKPQWFLQEIELPSDEEIEAGHGLTYQPHIVDFNNGYIEGFEDGADFILNHLK